MSPGAQTVTFVAVTGGAPDHLGVPVKIRTATDVPGCLMQPVNVSETVAMTDMATELWTCIADPVPAALALTTTDELVYDAVTYQVVGARQFRDHLVGAIDHVTVTCERRVG